jgi:hypothetical protein
VHHYNNNTSRVQYQLQEMEVTMTTLQMENEALKQEIAELNGEGNGGQSHPKTPTPTKTNLISTNMSTNQGDDDELSLMRRLQLQRRATNEAPLESDLSLTGSKNIDRKVLMDNMSEEFASICLKYQLDDQISAELYTVLDNYCVQSERSFVAIEERYQFVEKQQTKRTRDLEE